jgi:methylmalonyl-CoA mutase N-terminal domain/subunit
MTDDIERGAEELIARIERAGGTLAAIEAGFIQREIQESAYRAQVAIDSGEAVVVGVNRFTEEEQSGVSSAEDGRGRDSRQLFSVDPEVERTQIERVRGVRASRDASACSRALGAVTDAARGGSNLVPPIIGAVEARATVGEISDAMRSVFGEYQDMRTI